MALEKAEDQFALMQVIVNLQPSEQIIKSVVVAYTEFIRLLKKAVKYYSQCRSCKYDLKALPMIIG